MKHSRGLIGLVLGWLALAAPAAAHEFWIAPDDFTPVAGAAVSLSLRVGEMLEGTAYPYLPDKARRFTYAGAAAAGTPGADPAGRAVAAPGLGTVVYESAADVLRYSVWQDFLDYLAYEGLGDRAAEHDALGFPRTGFTEAYFRAAKALVQAGPAAPEGEPAPAGLPLELVADANPYALGAAAALPLRLLWLGEPLPDHPVAVFWRDAEGSAQRQLLSTGSDGALSVTIRPGLMLVNAVELKPAKEGADVEWLSVWASLTFAVP